jgi:hypothetical protein
LRLVGLRSGLTEAWVDLAGREQGRERINATELCAERHATLQYVIAQHEKKGLELLRVSLQAGDEEALPVFSFQKLAREFLRSGNLGPDWYVRESYNGELVSLLLGPYANVEWILPNPLPEPLAAEDALLNLLDRENFVGLLIAWGEP